jgi:phenylacetic acid degradation operon negative regulatory protein
LSDRPREHAAGRRRLGTPPEGSARSLLLTVLGELVVPAGQPVWTASLLYVLAGLGVSEQTARQTFSRAADSGWLVSERFGREARWTVTREAVDIIDDITRRVLTLNTIPERWDGDALILIVTIPNDKRAARKRLHSALGWAGFGNPAPGLWASPHIDRAEEARQLIQELDLRDCTIAFIGSTVDVGLADRAIVRRAWNLDDVADRYAKLLAKFAGRKPEPGDDLLFTHLALVDEWRRFPYMDPQLPKDLLPNWIGHRAADIFVDLHSRWHGGAYERWREVVALTAPDSERAHR